jgi:hypothetical protein
MWVAATLHPDCGRGLFSPLGLPLHADDPAQRVHYVYQIALRFHHGVDGLVRHRGFIDDIGILTTLEAGGRLHVIFNREATLTCST